MYYCYYEQTKRGGNYYGVLQDSAKRKQGRALITQE
jgi:hypothetical protein